MNGDVVRGLHFDFSWRKGDIGIIAKMDLNDAEDKRRPEIVVYQRSGPDQHETCYTIAFFEKTKEGWDIQTVGRRLFDAMSDYHIDYNDFVTAVKYAHEMLDNYLELEKVVKDRY